MILPVEIRVSIILIEDYIFRMRIEASPVSEDILCRHKDRGKVLIQRDVCHLIKLVC